MKKIIAEYFLLFVILIGAFGVRLYKIDNPIADWHSWRQADTASVTKNYLNDGLDLLKPRYHDISMIQTGTFNPEGLRFVEFPIFNAAHLGVVKLIPNISFEMAGRLTSVLSAIVTTAVLYLIGKEVMGKTGGYLAAFFYAFIPYNIYFTRVILPEPFAVMLGVVSIYLFMRYLRRESLFFLYGSAIAFALGALSKPPVLFYGLPIAYLAYSKFGISGIFKRKSLLVAFDVALIPFFLWRIHVEKFPRGAVNFEWAFNGDGIRYRPAFWKWMVGERLSKMILGTAGLVPFTLGLLNTKTKIPLLIPSFFAGVFFYSIILATANVRHDYYQTFWVPAIVLALAHGVLVLWRAEGLNKILSRLFIVFAIGLMFLLGIVEVKSFYNINDPTILEAGARIDEIAGPDDLVIAPYNGDTAFLYQTSRWGWPVVDDSIDHLIEKGAKFYVSTEKSSRNSLEYKQRFKTIEEQERYIIIELVEPE